MDSLAAFYATHPFWIWLAVAALFLAVEVALGSGWLLWPAATAAAMAAITTVARPGPAWELLIFAALTVVATLAARRLTPRRLVAEGYDINDASARLIGAHGEAASAFVEGEGRVFVDGKEWAASLLDRQALKRGERVEVVAVVDGARLNVRSV